MANDQNAKERTNTQILFSSQMSFGETKSITWGIFFLQRNTKKVPLLMGYHVTLVQGHPSVIIQRARFLFFPSRHTRQAVLV